MKGILLMLVLAAGVSGTMRKPIRKDGMVIRTQQQDAELRDWIEGLQKENQRNAARAEAAKLSQNEVQLALTTAAERAERLQGEINLLQKFADQTSDKLRQAHATIAARNITIARLWTALIALVVLVAAFFVARQYFPFLKFL